MALIYLRGDDKSALGIEGNRIPRAAFGHLRSADEALREAHDAADAIRLYASERAEQVRQEGYEAGRREGREAALVEILGTLEVERRMRDLLAEGIGRVVEHCLRSLIGEIGAEPFFQKRLLHAIRTLPADGRATLHVAPGQAHVAKAVIRDFEHAAEVDLRWLAIHVDENCVPDEFVIETAAGFLDCRISASLDAARRILEDAVRRADMQVPR